MRVAVTSTAGLSAAAAGLPTLSAAVWEDTTSPAPPHPITPAEVHAMLASGGSATAYADDLLGVVEAGALVFGGIPAVVEEAAARDPLLGRTLRTLCMEKGWGCAADPDSAWAEYQKLAAEGCQVAEFFVLSVLLDMEKVSSETVDRMEAMLRAGFGHAGLVLCDYWTKLGRDERAFTSLRHAAELGNPHAAYLLGSRFWKGVEAARDERAALNWWLRAAEGRSPQAMVSIGMALNSGLPGLVADPSKAVEWFEAAAGIGYAVASSWAAKVLWNLGDAKAAAPHARVSAASGAELGRCLLGTMLRDGRGCERNPKEALAQFEAAAGDGARVAMVPAGRMRQSGQGCPADAAGAAAWFRKAAEAGDTDGMFEWGRVLLDGPGVTADPAMAEGWLRKAAQSGSAPAAERLGNLLAPRAGCFEEAMAFLEDAVGAGLPSAATALGYHLWPRQAEPAVALEIFRSFCKASDGRDVSGMLWRGMAHHYGVGTVRDQVAAFEWFLKAAQAGNSQAMAEVGHFLRRGMGTGKDPVGAISWLYKASMGGDAQGSRELAEMLDEGKPRCWEGPPRYVLEAFETAVTQSMDDDQLAETAKAMVDARTPGVSVAGTRQLERLASSGTVADLRRAGKAAAGTRYPEQGAQWLRGAVQLGDVQAAHALAMAIRGGRIAAKDGEEAARLLAWAAGRGHDPSKRALESRVQQPLTPDRRFAALDAMIGLEPVKRKLRDVAYAVELDARRRAMGHKGGSPAPAHLAFLGNPGTGKTTVAREVGAIYKAIGRLAKGHVVEVKRADLVGHHIGETERNTLAAFERAADGVLFVDEAYELSADDSTRDFGKKALGVLLTEMENRRDRVVVIVAGYVIQMEGFIDSNPGLPSRIPADNRIVFPDYEPADLLRIFDRIMHAEGFRATKEAREAAWLWCKGARAAAGKRFGNGRDVRDVLWAGIKANMGRRLCAPGACKADINLIVSDDVPRLAPS